MATVRWCCFEDEKKSEDIHAADLKHILSNILKLYCQKDYDFADMDSCQIPEDYIRFVHELLEKANIHDATLLTRLEALKPKAKRILFSFYEGKVCSDPLSRVLFEFSGDYDATMRDLLNPPPSTIDMSERTGSTADPDELWLPLSPEVQEEVTPFTSVGNLLNRLNAQLLRLNGRIVSDRDQSLGNAPKESIYYQL
jgi:hypothetical protein